MRQGIQILLVPPLCSASRAIADMAFQLGALAASSFAIVFASVDLLSSSSRAAIVSRPGKLDPRGRDHDSGRNVSVTNVIAKSTAALQGEKTIRHHEAERGQAAASKFAHKGRWSPRKVGGMSLKTRGIINSSFRGVPNLVQGCSRSEPTHQSPGAYRFI